MLSTYLFHKNAIRIVSFLITISFSSTFCIPNALSANADSPLLKTKIESSQNSQVAATELPQNNASGTYTTKSLPANVPLISATEPEVLSDNKKKEPVSQNKKKTSYTPLIYIGGVAVLAAGAAIALGGGGGGGGGDSTPADSGGTAPAPTTSTGSIVGPNLNGNWVGYFYDDEGDYHENLTATITHQGKNVAIQTTKDAGVARSFHGTISAAGSMLMYDDYDGEDWTTYFGPASENSINLADHIFIDGQRQRTYRLILKR